jgi:hypothetical protein
MRAYGPCDALYVPTMVRCSATGIALTVSNSESGGR